MHIGCTHFTKSTPHHLLKPCKSKPDESSGTVDKYSLYQRHFMQNLERNETNPKTTCI